jgi:hypothetical protein
MKFITASHLSDAALIEEIKRLSQSGREVTVALIVHRLGPGTRSGTSAPQPTTG